MTNLANASLVIVIKLHLFPPNYTSN